MLLDNACVVEQAVLQEPRKPRKLPIIFWCVHDVWLRMWPLRDANN